MNRIKEILIAPEALEYLRRRGLERQYLKATQSILNGNIQNTQLRIREPKEARVWYFRINKQFRALCDLEETTLFVHAIDNHQK